MRDVWKRTTEKDALIGIGMTGIGSGVVLGYDMKLAAEAVKEENQRVANLIGINKSARTTTVKPSGTSSLVLGTSSGIHAWHNDFYLRRIRVGKNESIYQHLVANHPELVEDEYFRPHDTAVITIPQKAPEGSILRHESVFQMLERVRETEVVPLPEEITVTKIDELDKEKNLTYQLATASGVRVDEENAADAEESQDIEDAGADE